METTYEDRQWAMLSHAIPLTVTCLSGLGWVAALGMYLSQKEKSRFIRFHALQQLRFQIVVFVGLSIAIGLTLTRISPILGVCIGIAFYMLSLIGSLLSGRGASLGLMKELPLVGESTRIDVGR